MPQFLRSARFQAAFAVLAMAASPLGAAEAFGRWQQRPRRCALEQGNSRETKTGKQYGIGDRQGQESL